MRKSRYSDEQIAAALGQAEIETTVVDITRMLGISEATFYVWKKRFVRRKTVLPHIRKVWQLSERRACEILGVNRRAVRYQLVRGDVDVALLARIKSIAAVQIRYGQRRIHVLLRREGWPVNIKRVARLYREAGLAIGTKHRVVDAPLWCAKRRLIRRQRIRVGRWTSCTMCSPTARRSGC